MSASEQFVKVKWVKYRTPTYETGVRIAGLKPIVMIFFFFIFLIFPQGSVVAALLGLGNKKYSVR